jgi:hypothetical protein
MCCRLLDKKAKAWAEVTEDGTPVREEGAMDVDGDDAPAEVAQPVPDRATLGRTLDTLLDTFDSRLKSVQETGQEQV